MTRASLVQRLAEVSHDTYIRQAIRDKGLSREEVVEAVGSEATPHDYERAEDTVRELEALGVLQAIDAL